MPIVELMTRADVRGRVVQQSPTASILGRDTAFITLPCLIEVWSSSLIQVAWGSRLVSRDTVLELNLI